MSELIEIVLNAVDQASQIFDGVANAAEGMAGDITNGVDGATSSLNSIDSEIAELQAEFETATDEVDRLTQSLADIYMGEIDGDVDAVEAELAEAEAEAERLQSAIQDLNSSSLSQASGDADELEREILEADDAVQQMNADLGIVNSSMLLQLAEQVGSLGAQAEDMAQDMNESAIAVGQLATQTGIAEPQMVSLINTISNATFPNDEAMMYVKSLDQMGVSSENLGQSATDLDKINDAFGMGAQTVNSLGQELGVLGVDMNNVSSAFNALSYANANTVGGMDNYFSFLRKYDSQFKELGYDVDQASVIIAAATQKYGGGRAALSGLSKALEEAGDDSRKLEEALGMQAGSIDNATQLTGEYEGQLQTMADEEAAHKTLIDQIGAAYEDLTLSLSPVLTPLSSFIGLIGSAGSFGLQIGGLKTLGETAKNAVKWIKDFNIATSIKNVLEGESAVASVAAALGITTEAAAADGAAISFAGLAVAEGAALWPILAIIAAVIALGVAIYEVGKYFGWWTDVGTMFAAIQTNVQRLWNAFINHPDVKAILDVITGAWNTVSSAIMGAISWITEFLGLSSGGEWDVTRTIIEAIGFAFTVLTTPIRSVISLIQLLYPYMVTLFNDGLVPIGEYIIDVLTPVWEGLVETWNIVMETVTMLIDLFTQFQEGQVDLVTVISTVLSTIWNLYLTLATNLGMFLINLASSMLSGAITAGANFLNGIILYISQVPGMVRSYLTSTWNYVVKVTGQWVTSAVRNATRLVNNVISHLRGLPGRAYTALHSVVSRIISAGTAWVNAAKNKAQSIVTGVYNVLTGTANSVKNALSGVKDAIVKPFKDAYDKAKKIWDDITTLGGLLPGGSAAGFDLGDSNNAMGFEIPETRTVEYSQGEITVGGKAEVDYNLHIDGLPEGVDTETVLKLIREFFDDPDFKDAMILDIVKSSVFQRLDAREKTRLIQKDKRARGV